MLNGDGDVPDVPAACGRRGAVRFVRVRAAEAVLVCPRLWRAYCTPVNMRYGVELGQLP